MALDLSRPVTDLSLSRPIHLAYLLAAVTDLAACERDTAGTARINESHTIDLARRLVALGAHIVFPSSNLVYDGSRPTPVAEDPVRPSTEYGRQKARVEAALLALGSTAVLRLSKVVGPATEPFASWVRKLRRGEAIEAFADKVCAPVTLDDAVTLLVAIGRDRLEGLFQASALRDLSYAEAAAILADQVGAGGRLVRVVSGRDRGVPDVFRPGHTTLDASRLKMALNWSPPEPEKALCEGLGV